MFFRDTWNVVSSLECNKLSEYSNNISTITAVDVYLGSNTIVSK